MMLPSLLPLGTACLLLAQVQAGPLSTSKTAGQSPKVTDDTVVAKLSSGDSVTVYLHGATVTSWKTSDGDEKIFLSTSSPLNGSAPIRGGIPVIFPNFSSAPKTGQTSKLPSHGFARNSTWKYDSSTEGTGDEVALKFVLDSASLSADYQAKWPYSASLEYIVTLAKDKLDVHFSVQNTDTQALDFQFLLHTYLTVPNINATTVSGLKGSTYQDKTQNFTVVTETSDALRIVGETDRIYSPASVKPVIVKDNGKPRVTVERSKSLPDVTIWNIWATKILTSADFAPKDAWQHYLAVEPGHVAKFNSLEPGKKWEASVKYFAHV